MLARLTSACHNHSVVIRHGRTDIGCEGCAPDAVEVTDEYAVLENRVEAEVLTWRCGDCGDAGEHVLPVVAADLDRVA
jgi:ribosomal protein S27E